MTMMTIMTTMMTPFGGIDEVNAPACTGRLHCRHHGHHCHQKHHPCHSKYHPNIIQMSFMSICPCVKCSRTFGSRSNITRNISIAIFHCAYVFYNSFYEEKIFVGGIVGIFYHTYLRITFQIVKWNCYLRNSFRQKKCYHQ